MVKVRRKLQGFRLILKRNWSDSKKYLMSALHKNAKLERDLVWLIKELKKSLKWTKSSYILSNFTNQCVIMVKTFVITEKLNLVGLKERLLLMLEIRFSNFYVLIVEEMDI